MAGSDPGAVTPLATWRSPLPVPTVAEARETVDAALRLLADYYVHLPAKQAVHGIDPVGRLRQLRERLDGEGLGEAPDALHRELHGVFASLRDYHTRYLAPAPYRDAVAFLPFHVEACWEGARGARVRRHLITRVQDGAPPGLAVGAVVTHWNGTPIEEAVRRHGETTAGCTPAVRAVRGLEGLTARTLDTHPLPAEDWVWVGVAGEDGRSVEHRVAWGVVAQPGVDAPGAAAVDRAGERRRRVRRALLAPEHAAAHDAFTFTVRERDGRPFGHLRLWSFAVEDAAAYVEAVAARLAAGGYDALLVDVRGNLGGSVEAAERLLQLLGPRAITPTRFAFRATAHASQLADGLALGTESFDEPGMSGELWSLSLPVTAERAANDTGQVVDVPCALIVDALSYSATDMFAAGFQDHDLGPVVGTDETTGAGGGVVMGIAELNAALPSALAFPEGPERAGFTVAVRRTQRIGPSAGRPLEDAGVRVAPEAIHAPTRRDLLHGNEDLLDFALRALAGRRCHRLRVEAGGGPLRFRVRGEGIAWVEVQLDGLPVAARGLGGRSVTLTVAPPDGMAPAVATFRGFAAEPRPGGGDVFRLVATLRRELSRSATGELR